MTVQKITEAMKPLEQVAKINEIIDNLGSGGESFVDGGYVTNCIAEIPQDIKLELNDGTLTLKAGSKIYVPNGNDVFYTVIIPNDIAIQGWSNVSGLILIDNIGSSYAFTDLSHCYSGASSPTIGNGVVWYDTTNNIIKRCNDGSTWTSGYSLPIAIATSNNSNPSGISGIASLDKVFNGFGFIGSVLFALPGVTGLLPNGRNEDGTLNNVKYTVDTVILREFSWDITGSGQYLALRYVDGMKLGSSATNRPFYQQEETPPTEAYSYWYKPSENCSYATFESDTSWTKVPFVIVGKIAGDATGKISSLTTKTTVKLIDENDVHNAEAVVETYSNGNNWYRIWSDGWCEQGGISTGVADIQLLKPFSNTDYGVVVTRRAQSENIPFVKNITVSGFTIGWKVEGQPLDVNFVNCTWKAFGYIS